MKYLLGVLALIAIALFFLMRGSSPSVPPTGSPEDGGQQPQLIGSNTPSQKSLDSRSLSAPIKNPQETVKGTTIIPALEGLVVSEDGKPVPGVTVRLFQRNVGPLQATSSADGTYVFHNLAPGVYGVTAESDTCWGLSSIVVNSKTTARHDIQVVFYRYILGSVKDARGKPIPGATVVVESPGQDGDRAETDADGCFKVRIMAEQNHVVAGAPRYETERKWIEGKPERVDFVLRQKKRREIDIYGVVKDSAGDPVPGITVRISTNNEEDEWSNLEDRERDGNQWTTSDNTGAYRIHAILWGVSNVLEVYSNGCLQVIPVTDGANRIRHDVILPWNASGATTVTGRVVNGMTGERISQAVIQNQTGGGEPSVDPNGEFRLSLRGRKCHASLLFSKIGYSFHSTTVFHDPTHPRQVDLGDIYLYPSAIIAVALRDGEGRPVMSNAIVIDRGGTHKVDVSGNEIGKYTITASSKQFQVEIRIHDPAYEPYKETVMLEAGATRSLEITLNRRAIRTYTVTVSDKSGNPVAGAVIEYNPGGVAVTVAVTNAAGTATLSAYSPFFIISANGYTQQWTRSDLPEDQETIAVVLGPPKVTASIVGTVVNEEGNPLPGAAIFCAGPSDTPSGATFTLGGSSPSAATDTQGRFKIQNLSPDATYTLWATHAREQLRSEDIAGIAPGSGEIVLTARKMLPGELVIQFAGADPPEGTLVRYETTKIILKETDAAFFENRTDVASVSNRMIRRENIEPGAYEVSIVVEGFAETQIPMVVISPGTSAVVGMTLDRGMTVAGKVSDKDGNPIVGVFVSGGRAHDYTSLDGSFILEHVSSLTTSINVTRGDRSQTFDLAGRDPANLQITLE